LYGGSLTGAQTTLSIKDYGDILYGGIASSGVIHTVLAYPQGSILSMSLELNSELTGSTGTLQSRSLHQDCVANINAIVDKFDGLVAANNKKAIQKFKELFGLGTLSDIRDFAITIAFPLGGPMNYPTNTWQELNWYPNYTTTDFFNFCSNVANFDAPAHITALDSVLSNYKSG
jgi:hypothetical protein